MDSKELFIDLRRKKARQKLVYGGAGLPSRIGTRRNLVLVLGRRARTRFRESG